MRLLLIALFYCFIATVHAQVVCRASPDCNGAPGDDLGVMTIENCCTNDAINGLAFSEGESCSPCIVFGFFNDSFVGEEQGQGHTVQAGYQKGAASAATNLVFSVVDTPGTAREGAGFDYTISTTQVRALFNRPTPPNEVLFIFRMDNIAQEENETLTLELRPLSSITLPTGRNVFFINTISLTIVDSDEVEIFFTEDDFRTNERNMTHSDKPAFMRVLVAKNARIANPVVLDVSPLKVEVARAVLSPSDLPENIPVDNPFSPPFADLSDFDNTTIRITFVPDELANDNERAAPIRIVNDAVNEANEQVFIVQLRLISATNPGSVILNTRPASLCRIIDDDIIRIGFEEPRYTYMEPKFDDVINTMFEPPTNLTAHGPIYLAKENNVRSEQTFRVIIQVAESAPPGENINPVTIEEDYLLGSGGKLSVITVEFLSSMQMVNFQFTLLSDNLPEGTEAFRASSSAADNAEVGGMEFDLPGYLPPVNLSAETFVIIEDDDPIIIGFEETNYIVNESVGALEVNVSVINPPPGVELYATINLGIQSIARTATGNADYEEINLSTFDVLLQFDEMNRRQSFLVIINDDKVLESTEDFDLELRFDPFVPQPSGVILSPNVSTVYIEDNDDTIVVGFVERMYTFIENQNAGTIQVRKNEDSNVPFQVRVFGGPSTSSLIQQSATAVNQTITFGAGPSAPDVISIQIPITGDEIALEAIESYDVNLEIVGSTTNIVIGRHEMTTVNVLDEDLVTVGFGSSRVTVVESSEEFRMFVVKDRVAVQDVTVTIVSQDDTASSNIDYSPSGIPGTVTIPASDPRAFFTGQIIDDLIALEPTETFTLTISNISPDNNKIQRGIETTHINITDNDIVRVRFEEPNYTSREESGQVTICLIKDLETAVGFVVHTITSDGTANDGSDYVSGPFAVNFGTSANETQCRQITVFSDNEREDSEDFFVYLNLTDTGEIRRGDPSTTVVAIEDTGIPVNDTIIGDPLMTVPILVSDEDLQSLNTDHLSLCYEIHGRKNTNFNLVTDECATVNAHYTDLTSYLNIIDQIGVRAVDNNGTCKNIQVNVDHCSVFVDERPLLAGSKYDSEGISVRRYSNRVRVSVPNCNELSLVMWVICETRTIEDPFGVGTVTGNMIKFVVMRGLNFGHSQAHGLLGQFWNVPVSVEPFTGVDRKGNPVSQHYVINITSTFSSKTRSYTGWLYHLTWSFDKGPCLYVGNSQGGPIYEVKDPNDPIIEGSYVKYIVPDLFSEDNFDYGLFEENNCLQ